MFMNQIIANNMACLTEVSLIKPNGVAVLSEAGGYEFGILQQAS